MEQVLNRVDRNQAFIKFLVFFLVTVVLVVAAVYVNYKLPTTVAGKLREQAEVQRQQDAAELKFIAVMREAVDLQDSVKDAGVANGTLKAQVDTKLASLYQLIQTDNTIYGQLNKVIAKKLDELQAQKMRVADIIKANETKYMALQAELQRCQATAEQNKVAQPQ